MTTPRIQSYDIYRGLLLAAMVAFHLAANLTALRFDHHYFYWVPMGFVVFLGVILARFLQGKTAKKLPLALKVLACFLVLNVPNYLKPDFNLSALALGDQALFSFEILLPMAMLIFATIIFEQAIYLFNKSRHTPRLIIWSAAAITFLALIALSLSGFYSYNLAFLLYGLVGYFMALDLNLHTLATGQANHSPPSQKNMQTLLAAAVCIFPFVILARGIFFDFLFLPQVIAAYFITTRFIPDSRALSWLGKNSFVIYIGHIIAIKLISMALGLITIRSIIFIHDQPFPK